MAAPPSLSEQYSLPNDEKPVESKAVESKPAEVEKVETAAEVAPEKTEDAPAPVEGSSEASSAPVVESSEAPADAEPKSNEDPAPAAEESSEAPEKEESGSEETADEIKLETAPADFRFPTTNQTRHCFTRYIEYHRCTAAKGEDAPECDKFAKFYRSLCPGEWVDRWNEQRENGTFPGPL
ncbi:cytochrome c oxidase subunit 6b-1 isoform X2 [Beta vulgaris subsp. vulgaris]|uniref:cytochrome c oxidase subunit 6b-1 isoform X2 n=1 Tax=Beta vulgaris subsp. vulgaris TaxID=3555 RepID=UPI002036E1C6|nr:cytochrome c oxidase subunit 6b-1 isoform X2 [Beta vulgaris subsp. vulgaris]